MADTVVSIIEYPVTVSVTETPITVTVVEPQTVVTESGTAVSVTISESPVTVTTTETNVVVTIAESPVSVLVDTIPDIASNIHAATSKAIPVDADEIPIADSAASWLLKKLTWANLKATAKTYFDTLYAALGHTHTTHDPVTVADSTSIDLTLTGQQISAAAIFGTAAGTVTEGNDARLSDVRPIWEATHDVILATTKAVGIMAFGTDDFYLYKSAGAGAWYKSEFPLYSKSANPDIGAVQDSPNLGYGAKYVTDKVLVNVDIGNAADTTNAGANRFPIRANAGYLEVYISSTWQKVVVNFQLAETGQGASLLHKPVGYSWWYDMEQNSIFLADGVTPANGSNGYPLVQHGLCDIGCQTQPRPIGGRTS